MIIETDRLILRNWRSADRASFAAINKDPDVMRYLGAPLTRRESDAAIDQQIALFENNEPAFWAVELKAVDAKNGAALIGCIGVKKIGFEASFTPAYEIGWRLGREHWGRGYALEGAKAALRIAFASWDMAAIYSFTVPANIKSQSVMRKIGMTRIIDGDFAHPNLAKDHPLSRHILYKIERGNMLAS